MSTKRIRVAILGATGSVGQKLIARLEGHPWFEIAVLTGSERTIGRRYGEAVHWLEPGPIPDAPARLEIRATLPPADVDLAFSALGTQPADEVEPAYARAGVPVVSNAGAYRMAPDVPLLIPDINPDHVGLTASQHYDPTGRGFLVTNPNCSTTGMVMALKPLHDAFGVEAVHVTTLQATSGAGYPGVASLDILGNVVPLIPGEEAKLEAEPRKILGRFDAGTGGLEPAEIAVSAHATRVPVVDGHFMTLSVRLGRRVTPDEAAAVLRDYESPLVELGLPSAPHRPVVVLDRDDHPQPRLHAALDDGMVTTVGRIRPCPLLDIRLAALVHNTVRGAAGGTVLNAELLVARGLVRAR